MRRVYHSRRGASGAARPASGAAMAERSKVSRQRVDLSGFPDLVVIYLGLRASSLPGLRTLARTVRQISAAVSARPVELVRHENVLVSLAPPHAGMRQYGSGLYSLERWTRE